MLAAARYRQGLKGYGRMRDAMIGEANARTAHAFWGTWRINAEKKNLPPLPHLHAQESSHITESSPAPLG